MLVSAGKMGAGAQRVRLEATKTQQDPKNVASARWARVQRLAARARGIASVMQAFRVHTAHVFHARPAVTRKRPEMLAVWLVQPDSMETRLVQLLAQAVRLLQIRR
jgi:hypothetical protein